ncbi:hypothetical protein B0H14DRAFT_2560542 [Mycena olivaceomarginata]|nr:hypothetical protein B0H14DRAFT_2560542 [Mycena olivaceomarginata]
METKKSVPGNSGSNERSSTVGGLFRGVLLFPALHCFDPGILSDDYGVRSDILPFTHGFPRADIHELLTIALLHQLIKGKFKDHLVAWVNEYLHLEHGEKRALEIMQDID